jgi:hypothetical protein
LTSTEAIACLPAALEMNVKVGVAEGDWQTVFSLTKPTIQSSTANHETSGPDGRWEADVEMTQGPAGDVALAFHYSVREDFETRMVQVTSDGVVSPLQGNASHGVAGLRSSIVSRTAADYAQIKEVQLQKRPYQWVEFRGVSLMPGHRSAVESIDAAQD